jgi:hypothetical protein
MVMDLETKVSCYNGAAIKVVFGSFDLRGD